MVGTPLRPDDPGLDWFGTDTPAAVRATLAGLASIRRFERGDVLFHEGEEAVTFGIVRTGRVALRVLVPERGDTTILTVEPGDVIGWSAISWPFRSTSTAVALEPAEVLEFEGAAMRGVLRADCMLGSVVYPRLLEAVARRLMATREQLLDIFANQDSPLW